MIDIAVLGADGRMGRMVVAETLAAGDLNLVAAIADSRSSNLGADVGLVAGAGQSGVTIARLDSGCFNGAQVVVDFSLPQALEEALPLFDGVAVVSGTTGLTATQTLAFASYGVKAPVLLSSNFSSGITLMHDILKRAAATLHDYDIEIVEAHHRDKRDSPSGTALSLGRTVAKARGLRQDDVASWGRKSEYPSRPPEGIGFHSLRCGDVVGEHHIWLAGDGERITFSHVATSRSTFARGALRAARWLVGRDPGYYSMQDVLGLS
ncbi:MAG: 4-hydroxy-tetrahydrodipicolinate reductase [Proteobacteria bacterium]|nr:4-hydroxy-tetrahydrodipicolinate reductase [Pseudomonadota bacterium]